VVVASKLMRLWNEVSSPLLAVGIPLEATMKKTLLIAGALLALTASMSFAGGVNLSWSSCGANGVASVTKACTNNSAVGTLYCTATPPVDMNQANGQVSVVDVQTTQATLDPWWRMDSAGCTGRTTAVSCNMDFTAAPDNVNCNDPWAGQASPGANVSVLAPGRLRLKGTGAISATTIMDAATEWAICKLSIGGAKTAGTGNCAGCLDGACIVLNDVFLTEPIGVGDYHVTNALVRQFVTYQSTGAGVGGGCPGATPTLNKTWGSVKTLYR